MGRLLATRLGVITPGMSFRKCPSENLISADHLIGTGNQRRQDVEAERAAAGPGLNQSLLRERRKLPFAWRRLDHLGERPSIVEELGPPQDCGRGTTAPRFVCQPPGPSFIM